MKMLKLPPRFPISKMWPVTFPIRNKNRVKNEKSKMRSRFKNESIKRIEPVIDFLNSVPQKHVGCPQLHDLELKSLRIERNGSNISSKLAPRSSHISKYPPIREYQLLSMSTRVLHISTCTRTLH